MVLPHEISSVLTGMQLSGVCTFFPHQTDMSTNFSFAIMLGINSLVDILHPVKEFLYF